MAKIQDSDQFIVRRGDSYFTARRETVVEGITIPNAVQGDKISGTPGKIFPSNNFIYDENTGFLDINFPNTLNFVGEITEDLQPPSDTTQLFTGDFYIVNPDIVSYPDGKLTLRTSEWPGIVEDTFTSVELKDGGSTYRGRNGVIPTFGDGDLTSQRNLTNPQSAYGFTLSVSLVDGYIRVDDATIRTGGFSYSVDDIIEFRQKEPTGAILVHVKVLEVDADGAVTNFEFVENEDGNSLDDDETLVGGNYFASPLFESYEYNVHTIPRSALVKGSGMLLDLTMLDGRVINATVSSLSSHIGYVDGDQLFIYNSSKGIPGDARVAVLIDQSQAAGTFTATKNDKIIWSEKIVGDYRKNEFVLIKDSISNSQITKIEVPVYTPNNTEGYGNPHFSIITQRSSLDENTYNISIKDAKYVIDASGNIDIYNSYSGFLSAEDKLKIDELTAFSLPDIVTTSSYNSVTGKLYKSLIVNQGEENISISAPTAGVGSAGVASISSDIDLSIEISSRYSYENEHSTKQVSKVCSSQQTSAFFLPNNFNLLPNY